LNWMRLDVPALAQNVALVRVVVGSLAAQAEFTLEDIEDIRIAVSEAFSNAVLHAYPNASPGRPGTVTVEGRLTPAALEVTVTDHGVGIPDVRRARQPEFTTREDRMGLGFSFMEAFMDELEVRTAAGSGTTVVMRKRCRGGEASSGTGVAGR